MAKLFEALFPFSATTDRLTVRVAVNYLPEQSAPDSGRWFWSYHVRIENDGEDAVQLLGRYWRITDGRGNVHEVRGQGVVGEMPVILPGQSYDYVSGCPLDTPSGAMVGSYTLVGSDGNAIDVAIPAFPLTGPATAAH